MLIAEVQRLWLETRKTIVFVTHNVLEAVTLGDRVICMGTRPGRIKRELHVQLARPRVVEDPDTARMAQRILADLRDEVAKIVQEESDIDTTVETADTRGGAAPLLHPDPGILGDGI
jgi:NitT/TauT family transport system ATP-binding protein